MLLITPCNYETCGNLATSQRNYAAKVEMIIEGNQDMIQQAPKFIGEVVLPVIDLTNSNGTQLTFPLPAISIPRYQALIELAPSEELTFLSLSSDQ